MCLHSSTQLVLGEDSAREAYVMYPVVQACLIAGASAIDSNSSTEMLLSKQYITPNAPQEAGQQLVSLQS